jgi:hypothetical protein
MTDPEAVRFFYVAVGFVLGAAFTALALWAI